MSGYSEERAYDLIEEHEEKAEVLEREANEMAESETFNRTGSNEKRDEAQKNGIGLIIYVD